MNKPKLGQTITLASGSRKLSIRLPCREVVAGQTLFPGQAIYTVGVKGFLDDSDRPQLIVDPFLATHVNRGQWFLAIARPTNAEPEDAG